ncbi:MAG: Mo-dependent nitrogenase C-terminal domain-containing protein [Geitlerinemataceae cyanobacterium]
MNVWIATLFPFIRLSSSSTQHSRIRIVEAIQQWMDGIEVRDRAFARWLCHMIPQACPFERNIQLFGRTLWSIPPLCKLNPFYEQLVGLRFRALCYLADVCGEDTAEYS